MKTKNITTLFKSLTLGLLMMSPSLLSAQDNAAQADTIYPILDQLRSDVKSLNKLKISGYIQAQWQKADTIGSPAGFSGGNFSGYDNRFSVRRGRLKAAYSSNFSDYVLQIDVTQGGVAIKDAYAAFTDPWTKIFTVTGGAFNRPFGYEVSYSSASLESPERSRIMQTLFPNEEDLGAQLAIQAPSTSPLNFIKLQGGLFTGNGLSAETDNYKDFIGQIILKKSFCNENLQISGGASYYNGGFAALNPAGTTAAKTYAYVYNWKNAGFAKDSVIAGAKLKREYIGLDLQVSFYTGIGMTTLKGEYITGTQPGTASANAIPTTGFTPTPGTPVTVSIKDSTGKVFVVPNGKTTASSLNYYSRSINGGYVTLIQNLFRSKHDIEVKYDWYDPNTKISGNDIRNTGDLKYSTIGLGWIYHWNNNVKITVYKEFVKNETSKNITGANFKDYSKDQKDNILTIRLQYKF